MNRRIFSWSNFWALVVKEFIQMRRDRVTWGMMVTIPLLQLVLFGFAINVDPKSLPTGLLSADQSAYTRSLVQAISNTGYFDITEQIDSGREADRLMRQGDIQFFIQIPPNFTEDLLKGDRPPLLVVADATDPAATGNALAALSRLTDTALRHDLQGPLAYLEPKPPPFDLRIQRRYNPETITQYNIVPGLVGVVLTMTLMIMTALAITKEQERGTMEHLLSLPLRPVEVMLGKVFPYIFVGYVQLFIILLAARYVFNVPEVGSTFLLSVVLLIFIIANLLMGFTFSTLAANQLQAVQMSFFFFLPSILLSGFMFPFEGMPTWAQATGDVLPPTHPLRITPGILLKAPDLGDTVHDTLPIPLFFLVMAGIALLRYRQTLD
jgi:ABC-2 type transport system permease protein